MLLLLRIILFFVLRTVYIFLAFTDQWFSKKDISFVNFIRTIIFKNEEWRPPRCWYETNKRKQYCRAFQDHQNGEFPSNRSQFVNQVCKLGSCFLSVRYLTFLLSHNCIQRICKIWNTCPGPCSIIWFISSFCLKFNIAFYLLQFGTHYLWSVTIVTNEIWSNNPMFLPNLQAHLRQIKSPVVSGSITVWSLLGGSSQQFFTGVKCFPGIYKACTCSYQLWNAWISLLHLRRQDIGMIWVEC